MFDVLVFVYENYWHGDACPELAHLQRKLSAVGFDPEEIQDALTWLDDLNLAASGLKPSPGQASLCSTPMSDIAAWTPSPHSTRVYSVFEQNHLGAECMGFVTFLEASGAMSANMRELVLDRAMAAPSDPLPLADLKIIVLMVYWSLGQEPDALVLDELCEDTSQRIAH